MSGQIGFGYGDNVECFAISKDANSETQTCLCSLNSRCDWDIEWYAVCGATKHITAFPLYNEKPLLAGL